MRIEGNLPHKLVPLFGQNEGTKDDYLEAQKVNQIVQQLRRIEQKVVAHEMAHKSVAGKYAGVVHYTYTKGPDGKLYITGGEVELDISEEPDPEETAKKMDTIQAAALAPADPSPQDLRVAQLAAMKKIKAQMEAQMKKEEKSAPGSLISTYA